MSIHIGTAMVRRRVLEDDASRDGRAVEFQQEAIRVARWMAGVIILIAIAWGVWK